MEDEDNGWKIIQADVFRFPQHKSLFCAILGLKYLLMFIITSFYNISLNGLELIIVAI